MKKFLSLTLCLVLAVCSLTACGNSEEGGKNADADKADKAKLTAKVIAPMPTRIRIPVRI